MIITEDEIKVAFEKIIHFMADQESDEINIKVKLSDDLTVCGNFKIWQDGREEV